MLGSISVNLFIIYQNYKTRYKFRPLLIFIFFTTFSLININFHVSNYDFIKILMRYVWFISSIMCSVYIINNSGKIFPKVKKFSIIFAILVIVDCLLSYLLYRNIHIPQEGIRLSFFNYEIYKYLSLIAIPFLIYSSKKFWVLALFLFLLNLLSTRSLIIASFVAITFSFIFYYRHQINNKLTYKVITYCIAFIILISTIFITKNIRTQSFFHSSSMIARVYVWGNYLSLLQQFPLGTGPQGGFYLLQNDGFHSDLTPHLNVIKNFDNNIDLNKRQRILKINHKARSEESIFVSYITSYGFIGFIIISYLILHIFKIIFCSFFKLRKYSNELLLILTIICSVLTLGFFNSFHSGIFFLNFLFILFFKIKKTYSQIL